MRAPLAGLAGLFLLALPAAAQQAAPVTSERLLVKPPVGFDMVFHDRKNGIEMAEMTPRGQTIQDWTDMLTVQLIDGQNGRSPQEVLTEQFAQIKEACEDVAAGPISLAAENGYDTALRAVGCTKAKKWGKGEVSLYKVIKGHDRLYIIARAWRGDPFPKGQVPVPKETTATWLTFMSQVLVCDVKDPKHPCPGDDGK